MEVINADEDLRVTDGGGEVDAVTGIGRFLRELVLYNTPIISVQVVVIGVITNWSMSSNKQ